MTAALIALDVHGNGIAEPELTADQQREEGLKRLQRLAVTTDEHRQIGRGDIEDKLPLVPVILIDRRILGVKVEQKVTKNGDGEVGDGVELLVGELLTRLAALSDLSVRAANFLGYLLKLVSHVILH